MCDFAGNDIAFVEYDPCYRDQVIELQKTLWDTDIAHNSAYFAWKHESNPYNESPVLFLGVRKDRVVAMRGFWSTRWRLGAAGRMMTVLQPCDSVVASGLRGQGVGTAIQRVSQQRLADRGYELLLSTSAFPALAHIYSKNAVYRSVGTYRPMRWQTTPTAVLRRVDHLLQRTISGVPGLWRLAERKFVSPLVDKGGLVASVTAFPSGSTVGRDGRVRIEDAPRPDEMAALVARPGHDGRMTHVRDRAFFDWRYRNPLARYRFLYREDDGLEGYLVLHARRFKHPGEVSIVDCEAMSGAVRRELLQAATACAEANTITVWSATLSEPERGDLETAGFRLFNDARGASGYLPQLYLAALTGAAADAGFVRDGWDLSDMASWDLRMIFADNF